MNKSDLVSRLATTLGTSKSQATRLLQTALAEIERGLAEDGSVVLTKFGTFLVRQSPARQFRCPHTGALIELPPRKRVSFRSSPCLRRRFNP